MTTTVYLVEKKRGKKEIVVRAKLERNESVDANCLNCGEHLSYHLLEKKCSYCKLPIKWFVEDYKQPPRGMGGGYR